MRHFKRGALIMLCVLGLMSGITNDALGDIKVKKDEVVKKRRWDLSRENPIDHDYSIEMKSKRPWNYDNEEFVKLNEELYISWDKELNNVYYKLMNNLDDEKAKLLQRAQKGWLKNFLQEEKLVNSLFKVDGEHLIEERILKGYQISQIDMIRRRTLELIDYYKGVGHFYEFQYEYRHKDVKYGMNGYNQIYLRFNEGKIFENNKYDDIVTKEYERGLKKIDKSDSEELVSYEKEYDQIWDRELNYVYEDLARKLDDEARAGLLDSQMGWIQYHMYDDKFNNAFGNSGEMERIVSHKNRIKRRTIELLELDHLLGGDFQFNHGDTYMNYRLSGSIMMPENGEFDGTRIGITLYGEGANGDIKRLRIIELSSEENLKFEFFVPEGEYFINFYNFGDRKVSKYKWGQYSDINISGEDVRGVELKLQENECFKGTVTLPQGQVAPEGGIRVNIDGFLKSGKDDGAYNSHTTVVIKEGENQAYYKLYVVPGEYYVDVDVQSNFYESFAEGVQGDINMNTSEFKIHEGEKKRLDIKMQKRDKSISGKVRLPEGEIAPEGGLDIRLSAFYGDYEKREEYIYRRSEIVEDIHIKEGETWAEYHIPVLGLKYRLEYEIITEEGRRNFSDGYFNYEGYTGDLNKSSELDLTNDNIENLDIDIMKNIFIHGNVGLAQGQEIPKEGFMCRITPIRIDEDQKYRLSPIYLEFKEGQENVDYTLPLQGNEEYVLEYEMLSVEGEAKRGIYFGYNGFKYRDIESVKRIKVFEEDMTLDDVQAGMIYQVKGNISLADKVELEEAQTIQLIFHRETSLGKFNQNKYIRIPKGENNVDFKVYLMFNGRFKIAGVPKGDDSYRVTYCEIDGKGFLENDADYFEIDKEALIKLKIQKKSGFQGRVFLSGGKKAPRGGTHIKLTAYRANDNGASEYVVIPEGENSVKYELLVGNREYNTLEEVKEMKRYIIKYEVLDSKPENIGYYNLNGTVKQERGAMRNKFNESFTHVKDIIIVD